MDTSRKKHHAPQIIEQDFDIDLFLQRPLMAHLATASEDGPRESPVWYLWEDSLLWLVGTSQDSFPKRIQKDGRCAIGIVDFDVARGRLQHVGFRGHALVLPLEQDRLYRLLRRYLGDDQAQWNPWFQTHVIAGLDVMIQCAPTSIVARDQSYFAQPPGPQD
jgi:hypothetical protein